MPLKSSQTSVLSSQTGWQPCTLTWYDPALGGTNSATGAASSHSATASGEPYNPAALTCAAPSKYSFGTMLTFRYRGQTVTCRVNDRGGAIQGTHFDLSRAAANQLGMLQAGTVQASFTVGGNASSTAGGQSAGAGPSGGGLGSVIQVLTDLVTLDIGDLGARLALVGVSIVKDVAVGIGDLIVIPAWHWNQRAVYYYEQHIIFGSDPYPQMWTAAFWAFGYWLLWTDPNSKGLKPQPVRNSRLARHVRGLQGIPARTSLIKPSQVRERTPRKPKPVISSVPVREVGILSTARHQRVRVTGTVNGREPVGSNLPIERAGTLREDASNPHENAQHTQDGKPHPSNTTGASSSSDSERSTPRPTGPSAGERLVTRHRRVT